MVWPRPHHFEHGSEVVWLSPHVKLTHKELQITDGEFASLWIGQQSSASSATPLNKKTELSGKDVLEGAIQRFKDAVFQQSFVPEKFHPRNEFYEPGIDSSSFFINEITIQDYSESVTDTSTSSPEAYTIEITSSGSITIQCSNYLGGLRALSTIQQLFYNRSQDKSKAYLTTAPLVIRDVPALPHRGLNLDISRNQIYPDDVLRTLSAMSLCKFNRLHLHATDSQSWPLDIRSIPSLAEKGAYSARQIWSATDLDRVQRFGAEHGIEVYLEIDMPGHMGAVWHSHPDLTVAYSKQWDKYAVEPPAGQLKLLHPGVKPFIQDVLSDVLPRTGAWTALFHLGMDELNTNAYTLEPGLESSSKETLQPLLQSFLDTVFASCAQHSHIPLAWEEIVLDWDLCLPPSTIIQTWRSADALVPILEKGYRALFGAATHWYLDTGLGTFLDPDPAKGKDTGVKPPFPDWLPPYKNFRLMLEYDPLAGVPEDLKHLVLGGEAHLWGELTDSVSLDGMLWPRAAAAAEVLWAGKGVIGEESTRRLAEWRERVLGLGVRAGVVQMEWILRNKGGGLL
ncbi:MAG: N-acetyl-glucosamine-6-phosphate deacetylase [Stictis urceolatum]|nr:N-acetyl-glucosamine-6-phosphate deacetylase [Stictis urceolata]